MKATKVQQNAQKAAEAIEELKHKEYLRSKEIAQLFSISYPTLKNLRKEGKIPCYKLGGIYLYKREEIIEYIQKNRKQI